VQTLKSLRILDPCILSQMLEGNLVNISHLYRSVKKNNTLLRTYQNFFAKKLTVKGKGIDLGAKSIAASYYAHVDMSSVSDMTFVDYFHSGESIIQMDLENEFPIKNDSFDFVFSFNVMEHIYNYHQLLSETFRVLRCGGRLHGFVPFMVRYHPDPHDYFRYTKEGLERSLADAGFIDIEIIPMGGGPFKLAVEQLARIVRFRSLRFIMFSLGIGLDRLIAMKSSQNPSYSLGFYFTGVKSVKCEGVDCE